MNRLLTVGAFSVASALVWACGDDSGDPAGNGGGGGSAGSANGGSAGSGNAGSAGSAGSGGNAGTGGTAGNAGTGGNAGSSGSAGSAGSSGSGGSGGSANDPDAGDGGLVDVDAGDGGLANADAGDAGPPPCTGCLELRVTLAAGETAFFQVVFDAADLSGTVAQFRLRTLVLDPTNQLFVQTFANDSDFDPFSPGTFRSLNAANFTDTETFVNVPLDFGAIPTVGFVDTDVRVSGLQVAALGGLATPTTVVLLLDSLTYDVGPLTDLDFTTDAQGFAVNVNAGLQTAEVIHH